MKTSIYNKAEHIEGYVNTGDEKEGKSDVQKAYEQANDGNEVTSFGKEPDAMIKGNPQAKDGMDNSGTQGKDPLSDDPYNSKDEHPTVASAESHTGSAGSDFEHSKEHYTEQQDEDHALDTGI